MAKETKIFLLDKNFNEVEEKKATYIEKLILEDGKTISHEFGKKIIKKVKKENETD